MSLFLMDPEPFIDDDRVGHIASYAPPMHEIVHELTIAAAPETIFAAVTTHDGLSAWWSKDATAAAAIDEVARIPLDDGTELALRVDLVEAPELIHWQCVDGPREWVGTSIALRIEGDGEAGSVIRFWHGGWPYADGVMPRCSFEWAMRLDRLRRHVEA